jgi:copper chaperone
VQHIKSWEVDTANPEKILTVKEDDIKSGDVVEHVQQAGYRIEEKRGLRGSLFG